MDIRVLRIDLGKTVCSLAGLDEAGAVVFRKRLKQHLLLPISWKKKFAKASSGDAEKDAEI